MIVDDLAQVGDDELRACPLARWPGGHERLTFVVRYLMRVGEGRQLGEFCV